MNAIEMVGTNTNVWHIYSVPYNVASAILQKKFEKKPISILINLFAANVIGLCILNTAQYFYNEFRRLLP